MAIPGVVLVEPRVFGDARGFVIETFRQSDFVRAGIPVPFVQENHSHSARGTLRGLHYQREPYAQGKFVRVVPATSSTSPSTCGPSRAPTSAGSAWT